MKITELDPALRVPGRDIERLKGHVLLRTSS
jgi:hypothetical protein